MAVQVRGSKVNAGRLQGDVTPHQGDVADVTTCQRDVTTGQQVITFYRGVQGRQGSRSRVARRSRSSTTSRSDSRSSQRSSVSRHRRPKIGEFDQVNFLANKEKIDTIEKLLLVNVRLVKVMYDQGEDIFNLIAHIEMID